MDIPSFEHEPQQDPLEQLRAYWEMLNAIHRREVSADDYPWRSTLQLAEMYVQAELDITDSESTNLIPALRTLLPHPDTLKGGVCEAQERSYMLPLVLVGDFMEAGYYAEERNLEEIVEWYDKAVTYAICGAGVHSIPDCLAGYLLPEEYTECKESSNCPIKEVHDFLVKDAVLPSSASLAKAIDPERAELLVQRKLDLARKFQLIQETEYETILAIHEKGETE